MIRRRFSKKDKVHNSCVKAAKELGATILETYPLGEGKPDFIAGYRGVDVQFEAKTGNAKLKNKQDNYRQSWNGRTVEVVRTPEQVREILLSL
jgi:penicillin-binding protein-related factor A (putative recombinase)